MWYQYLIKKAKAKYLVIFPLVLFSVLYVWLNVFFMLVTDKHVLHTTEEHGDVKEYLLDRYEQLRGIKKGNARSRNQTVWSTPHNDMRTMLDSGNTKTEEL